MTIQPTEPERWVAQCRKLVEACGVSTGNMTDREIVERADRIGAAFGEFGYTVGGATARAVEEMTPTFRALAATFRDAGAETIRRLRDVAGQAEPEAASSEAGEPAPGGAGQPEKPPALPPEA